MKVSGEHLYTEKKSIIFLKSFLVKDISLLSYMLIVVTTLNLFYDYIFFWMFSSNFVDLAPWEWGSKGESTLDLNWSIP